METRPSLNSLTDFWASLRFCKELDRLGSLSGALVEERRVNLKACVRCTRIFGQLQLA